MIALELKIYSYHLLNYFRFHMPGVDCFIVELVNNRTEESEQHLAKHPSTLVYTFANPANFTIKNLLLTNKR